MPIRPPTEPHPSLDQLRAEYRADQERAMVRVAAKRRRDLRNATIAGAAAGLAAVMATAGATRTALHWHSFLLEAILGAVAGHLLARWHGGPMKGLLLFSGSYFLAFLLRACGLDPGVLFVVGDVRAAVAVQGHVVSLCVLLSVGIAVGHVIQD